jgi:hypothetical protein
VAVRWVFFDTAVPFWSSFLADARHLPHGRSQAGTATSTSTETGTTSKLEQDPARPKIIATDPGIGYRWLLRPADETDASACPPSWQSSAGLVFGGISCRPGLL